MGNIKFEFSGQIVLITGAATGMGRETALNFAKAGATVIVADFNEDEGKKTTQDCKDLGSAKAAFYKIDVADEAKVKSVVDKMLSDFGYIDILVSNAGVGPGEFGPPFTNISPTDMRRLYDINTIGYVNMIQALYENFTTRKQGKIVCVASIAAFNGSALIPHYSASKAAVFSLMKSTAAELGRYNINVNAIAPGFVYTPIYHNALKFKEMAPLAFADCNTHQEVVNKMAGNSCLHRVQTEEDMANAIMFLCTEEAKNIAGHCLAVDAGRMAL